MFTSHLVHVTVADNYINSCNKTHGLSNINKRNMHQVTILEPQSELFIHI